MKTVPKYNRSVLSAFIILSVIDIILFALFLFLLIIDPTFSNILSFIPLVIISVFFFLNFRAKYRKIIFLDDKIIIKYPIGKEINVFWNDIGGYKIFKNKERYGQKIKIILYLINDDTIELDNNIYSNLGDFKKIIKGKLNELQDKKLSYNWGKWIAITIIIIVWIFILYSDSKEQSKDTDGPLPGKFFCNGCSGAAHNFIPCGNLKRVHCLQDS